MILQEYELKKIYGGGWKTVLGFLAGAITLVSGIIDGIFRPLGCH